MGAKIGEEGGEGEEVAVMTLATLGGEGEDKMIGFFFLDCMVSNNILSLSVFGKLLQY